MSEIVYLNDGGSLAFVGIGSISLRIYDGVVMTIQCWNVPGIKASLISLSTQDS